MIYLVDSIIHFMNNPGQMYSWVLLKTRHVFFFFLQLQFVVEVGRKEKTMTMIFISLVDIVEVNYFCRCCQYQQIAPIGFWIPCFKVAVLSTLQ